MHQSAGLPRAPTDAIKVAAHAECTSMIARHKKPRHDLIVVLHLKSCGAAEKSLRGCLRRAIIEVATSRLIRVVSRG